MVICYNGSFTQTKLYHRKIHLDAQLYNKDVRYKIQLEGDSK